MSDTICIYHGNCADGFGAAWSVRHALGDDVEYYPGVYQQDPPDVTGKHVILVDFSYKKPVLDAMNKVAKSMLILDHHKSAAEDLAAYAPPLMGYGEDNWDTHKRDYAGYATSDVEPQTPRAKFDMEKSGAMLAWEFFNPRKPAPSLIEVIQDRDLWKFEIPGTREMQAALFSYPYDFEVWDHLMQRDLGELFSEGVALERKHFKDIKEFIRVAARRMTIAGHDVPCLNAPYFWSSDAGHIMAQGEPFAACYWDTPTGRVFSLRSADDGEDVSAVAVQYGGGGHKAAAGFQVPHGHDICKPDNYN